MGIHKNKQRLYKIYDQKTYNTSNSFDKFVRRYSKIFIKNEIKNIQEVVVTTCNTIKRENEGIKCRNLDF